jgi:hypothetical protein
METLVLPSVLYLTDSAGSHGPIVLTWDGSAWIGSCWAVPISLLIE